MSGDEDDSAITGGEVTGWQGPGVDEIPGVREALDVLGLSWLPCLEKEGSETNIHTDTL